MTTIADVTSMPELIERIDETWQSWITTIRALDEAALVGPTGAAGWTVRDHITHVTAWEATLSAALTGRPQHEALGIPKAVFENPDIDITNEHIRAAHAHLAGREAVSEALVGHDTFIDVLQTLPADVVARPMSDFVAVRTEAGARASVALWIWGDSGEHYPLHLEYIGRILADTDR